MLDDPEILTAAKRARDFLISYAKNRLDEEGKSIMAALIMAIDAGTPVVDAAKRARTYLRDNEAELNHQGRRALDSLDYAFATDPRHA